MGLAHPKTSSHSNMENMRETPALSPVFEGRLYLRSENKQWQLRLFRFDGTTLTCLSTRKVKLPPGTRLDPSVLDLNELVMNRSPSASVTSPLLATPANKSRTKPGADMAGYYQLPKWTVNVADISGISMLKNNKRKNLFTNQNSLCFCVRTYDDRCYVLKAQKEKDLERWLFILTKMWDFASALRSHFNPESQQQNIQGANLQHNDDNLPLAQTISPKTLAIITSQDQLPRPSSQNVSPHTPPSTVRKLVPPLPMENYGRLAQNSSPTDVYEQRYQMPQLSSEKLDWIDAWRNSLAELVASDPQIKLAPPVIEPIKDDDSMSIASEMTSITTRARLKAEETAELKPPYSNTTGLRRRITTGSRHSARKPTISRRKAGAAARLNIVGPAPELSMVEKEQIDDESSSPKLQRKRSKDVKNWIESDRRPGRASRSSSTRRPSFRRPDNVRPSSTPEVYSLNFFQSTTPSDETDSPKEPNTAWTAAINADDNGLKYHSSVRGKAIQLVQPSEKSKATVIHEDADAGQVRSRSSTPTSKRSSSPAPQSRIHHNRSSSSLRSDQIVSSSPLTNLIYNNAQAKRNSDMSSFDLGAGNPRRRYSGGFNGEENGPSFAETQQMMWQKHYHLQQQQHMQAAAIAAYQYPANYSYGSMPSLVSPAIPPVSVQHSFMSSFPRNFPSGTTPDDDKYLGAASDTPVINKRHQSLYYQSAEGKSYNDTSRLSDDLAQLRVRPKLSVADSDVSSRSRRPESWMGTRSTTQHHDLGTTKRKSMSTFNKLLDQRPAIRQHNHF
ncbi:hypothetical protein K450DRAFT_235728 [Umbelopsis ramanniana AG]|uniref:PH domain-containing protein n=1 Tax=Umbelopsis ramanniana AG TaxID=1314678 RepID=A0AAD5ECE9_UMBRA|nr:uncharacterized protein K450DRAFT_235728 [Umbelopsis ramanniana AG]KAI8580737.1 hypothetical protein K450DRAFT_235728 [Umbelopsis ramanniana AG]